METLNNPASRLLQIVKVGKTQKMDVQASKKWMSILSVDGNDKALLLRRIGHVMALPMKVKQEIESLNDINPTLLLKWMSKVEKAFGILNFQVPWKNFINIFDDEVIYGLEVCSDTLSRQSPEKILDEKKLNDLLKEVNELLAALTEIELDQEVRDFVLENLLKVKNALEEYFLRGIKPLENQFYAMIGQIGLKKEIYTKSKKSSFGKKFWKVMGALAILITITTDGPQLSQDVIAFLLEQPKTNIEQTTEENISSEKSNDEKTEIKSIDV